MTFLNYQENLERIKYYVESKSFVTVSSLSKKLEVSERTLYRMIAHLKASGINIYHCRRQKKYVIEK